VSITALLRYLFCAIEVQKSKPRRNARLNSDGRSRIYSLVLALEVEDVLRNLYNDTTNDLELTTPSYERS